MIDVYDAWPGPLLQAASRSVHSVVMDGYGHTAWGDCDESIDMTDKTVLVAGTRNHAILWPATVASITV